MTEKVRENRLRRMADRQGYRLVKSHRHDQRAVGYGCYELISIEHGDGVFGLGPTGQPKATLDDIEAWLTSDDPHETERERSQSCSQRL